MWKKIQFCLQVSYTLTSSQAVLGCIPAASAGTQVTLYPPSHLNTTAINNTVVTPPLPPSVAIATCPSSFAGYYANDACQYCCLGNLCNGNKPISWLNADCNRLKSSAATATMATVAMAVVIVCELLLLT